jgi:hypothetical protein
MGKVDVTKLAARGYNETAASLGMSALIGSHRDQALLHDAENKAVRSLVPEPHASTSHFLSAMFACLSE